MGAIKVWHNTFTWLAQCPLVIAPYRAFKEAYIAEFNRMEAQQLGLPKDYPTALRNLANMALALARVAQNLSFRSSGDPAC